MVSKFKHADCSNGTAANMAAKLSYRQGRTGKTILVINVFLINEVFNH